MHFVNERKEIGGAESTVYFQGSVDDLRVYDRAISATEVTALFNEGK